MNARVYKHYMLVVLLVILAFNYVDRLALGLMLEDIKREFQVSDTQLGLLSGIAFALFYSVMGVPVARIADRGDRVRLISVTAALWSVMVALCGSAGSFLQLLLMRMGVAVGEAGAIPPAHSLIADHFTRAERPRAVALYMLGGPLSVVIGYFFAGWVNQVYGWRTTFVMLGAPGIALSVVAWFTLREPRRRVGPVRREVGSTHAGGVGGLAESDGADESRTVGESGGADNSGGFGGPCGVGGSRAVVGSGRVGGACGARSASPPLKEVCATLWSNTTFCHLLFCFAVMSFFGYGISQWQPTFFIRSYGLDTATLGTWLAVIYGVGGFAGTYWGGELASRHAAGNEQLQLKVMAIGFPLTGLISAGIYYSPNHYIAFALLGVSTTLSTMANGPLFATIQTLVPEHMRAISVAVLYLFANLIGMGLGPLLAGALSDALHPLAGEESLRYALLALCPGYLWGGWHLWRASTTVSTDLRSL